MDTRLQLQLKNKLESRIHKDMQSGCWVWLGGCNSSGYGCIWGGKRLAKQLLAHRVSLFVYEGISLGTITLTPFVFSTRIYG